MAQRTLEASSSFTIRTRAVGLLSKVAHDLELAAELGDATVEVDGDVWKASLRFPVRGVRVNGVLKSGNRVDRETLSTKDRADIERKIQREVLPFDDVVVEAEGTRRDRGDVTIVAGRGRSIVSVRLATEERAGGGLRVRGDGRISMRALGLAEVKGPMGVFKVKDDLELAFTVDLA